MLDEEIALISWLYAPDMSYVFALDYRYVFNGDSGIVPWYKIDLETYEADYHFDAFSYRFVLARNPTTLAISPNNQKLATIVNESRDSAYLEILSLETGEFIHAIDIPNNRIAPGTMGLGSAVQWYAP